MVSNRFNTLHHAHQERPQHRDSIPSEPQGVPCFPYSQKDNNNKKNLGRWTKCLWRSCLNLWPFPPVHSSKASVFWFLKVPMPTAWPRFYHNVLPQLFNASLSACSSFPPLSPPGNLMVTKVTITRPSNEVVLAPCDYLQNTYHFSIWNFSWFIMCLFSLLQKIVRHLNPLSYHQIC